MMSIKIHHLDPDMWKICKFLGFGIIVTNNDHNDNRRSFKVWHFFHDSNLQVQSRALEKEVSESGANTKFDEFGGILNTLPETNIAPGNGWLEY